MNECADEWFDSMSSSISDLFQHVELGPGNVRCHCRASSVKEKNANHWEGNQTTCHGLVATGGRLESCKSWRGNFALKVQPGIRC